MPKSQQSEYATVEIRRMTGKQYPHLEAAFENLPPEALADLARLVRDIQSEMVGARQRAAREPWRR